MPEISVEPPILLKLAEGEGPVNICANHIITEDDDLDMDDDDDEEMEVSVKLCILKFIKEKHNQNFLITTEIPSSPHVSSQNHCLFIWTITFILDISFSGRWKPILSQLASNFH